LFFRRYSIKQSPDPIGIDLKKTRHHAPLARPQTISVVVRGPGLLVRSWDRALFCSSVERQSRSCTLPLQRLGDFARPRSHPRTPGRRGSLGSSAQTRSLGPIDLSQKRKKEAKPSIAPGRRPSGLERVARAPRLIAWPIARSLGPQLRPISAPQRGDGLGWSDARTSSLALDPLAGAKARRRSVPRRPDWSTSVRPKFGLV
jgi:hypothetical protein